jgi:hypothetical protein
MFVTKRDAYRPSYETWEAEKNKLKYETAGGFPGNNFIIKVGVEPTPTNNIYSRYIPR